MKLKVDKCNIFGQGIFLASACFILILIAYHLIFGQFFPTINGTLGEDYSRILPDLLDGYFWFKSNGIFQPFWFTPAFCGGQPALGAPESGFYSVAQYLTIFFDPLTSVYATVLLFASLGFWGFYLLLRFCFCSSEQAAVMGGALFMFNGFFIHRMLEGHFAFHGIMLIPLMSYLLLRPTRKSVLSTLTNGTCAGILLAYCTYTGMVHLIIPFILAVLGIASLYRFTQRELNSSVFAHRLLVAALVATCLSAAKLTAALLYLNNFPRSDYLLPGILSFWSALQLLFSTIFFSPADIAETALPLVGNRQWHLGRQEWEYGVTFVPLLIIVTGTMVIIKNIQGVRLRLNSSRLIWLLIFMLVLAIPLALNIYHPSWNAFLKQIPIIKSSIFLMRWFLVYIPLVIVASALFLDIISKHSSYRTIILLISLFGLVWINAVSDREFYKSQPYNPDTIIKAWKNLHSGNSVPTIQHISAFVNSENGVEMRINGNDALASNGSQLACYNPIFGYRLEHFPIRPLHPGNVFEERNGFLNIKNPACYTYAESNGCAPGDHFSVTQFKEARDFVNYKQFSFNFSPVQKFANLVTLATLAFIVILFAVTLSNWLFRIDNR